MMNLSGKTALMLGGIDQLADDIAESFAEAGAKVIIAHDPHDDPAALQFQLASIAPFDVAIISPCNFIIKPFMETTDADWDASITDNFEQALWTAQAVARTWVTQNRPGTIIFLSLVVGQVPHINMSALGTALGALRALAKMAAVELGTHKITVNVIESGWTENEALAPYLQEHRPQFEADTPTGHLVQASDIGNLCCFLASDAARNITGQFLTVDGGYTLTPGS